MHTAYCSKRPRLRNHIESWNKLSNYFLLVWYQLGWSGPSVARMNLAKRVVSGQPTRTTDHRLWRFALASKWKNVRESRPKVFSSLARKSLLWRRFSHFLDPNCRFSCIFIIIFVILVIMSPLESSKRCARTSIFPQSLFLYGRLHRSPNPERSQSSGILSTCVSKWVCSLWITQTSFTWIHTMTTIHLWHTHKFRLKWLTFVDQTSNLHSPSPQQFVPRLFCCTMSSSGLCCTTSMTNVPNNQWPCYQLQSN